MDSSVHLYKINLINLTIIFMKKFLLAAGLMLARIAASAQLYVGGTVGLNRNTTDNVT